MTDYAVQRVNFPPLMVKLLAKTHSTERLYLALAVEVTLLPYLVWGIFCFREYAAFILPGYRLTGNDRILTCQECMSGHFYWELMLSLVSCFFLNFLLQVMACRSHR